MVPLLGKVFHAIFRSDLSSSLVNSRKPAPRRGRQPRTKRPIKTAEDLDQEMVVRNSDSESDPSLNAPQDYSKGSNTAATASA